ncbi:hypothetical protein JCM19037_4737 [Geomicrobium sp. JCM 19037]|uniref:PH domain-containing protein n=1 Tax=Geomicrobium sp. JCM 19037 TaxID=1460634 RepID=UPI00045F12E0|nr:PH domain-containing protein [Geomicrobium sp. JCM 19037]GAK06161.1 hypothetical protein JCM19037_4737 [Geomicrobium sp. JCM 19037]
MKTRTSYSIGMNTFIIIVLIPASIPLFISPHPVGFAIIGFTILFIGGCFIIHYKLTDNQLHIYFCFFIRAKSIPLQEIQAIRPTRSLISAPAASIKDRLELERSGWLMPIIVSPKDQSGFIAHIERIHPSVDVDPQLSTEIKGDEAGEDDTNT